VKLDLRYWSVVSNSEVGWWDFWPFFPHTKGTFLLRIIYLFSVQESPMNSLISIPQKKVNLLKSWKR